MVCLVLFMCLSVAELIPGFFNRSCTCQQCCFCSIYDLFLFSSALIVMSDLSGCTERRKCFGQEDYHIVSHCHSGYNN